VAAHGKSGVCSERFRERPCSGEYALARVLVSLKSCLIREGAGRRTFLRRNARKHKGEDYDYCTFVESVRASRGPRQRVVAMLGELPGLDDEARVGWERTGDILEGKARVAGFLNAPPDPPGWASVNLKGVRVERLRSFGDVYMGLALWRRLQLDRCFNKAMEPGREKIPWATMVCILTLARSCAPWTTASSMAATTSAACA
jgi:hypothetical protein